MDEKFANGVAREAMGEVAWPTIALAAGAFLAYAGVFAGYLAGLVPLWAATLSIALALYACYTVLHEAVHGSIGGTNRRMKWVNEALGYVSGQLIGTPFIAHRKEHFAHHNHTNHTGRDPDLKLAGGSIRRVIVGTFRALPDQVVYFIENNWQHASRKDRAILITETVVGLGWRIAFGMYLGWTAAIALLVVANLTGIFVTLVFFAWLVHWPHRITGRYRDTGTFVFSGTLDTVISWLWLWLFQNYHSIHHLFPRVPFYRYRQVFRQIEPVMQRNGSPIQRFGAAHAPGAAPAAR